MTYYLIVAAVRIQPWIARTPKLSLVRGASNALKTETSDDTIGRLLEAGARTAVGSGDIDGVVAVQAQTEGAIRTARARVVAHLRLTLPGIEWAVWIGEADNYWDAVERSKHSSAEIVVPSALSVPFGRPCTGCGTELAGQLNTRGSALGPDCATRERYGVARNTHRYQAANGLIGPFADEFEDLAIARGNPARRAESYGSKPNHLATIAADGNGVGTLFHELKGSSTADRKSAADALDRAVAHAVKQAVHAIGMPRSDTLTPALLHFRGGDDILISVPAPLAWEFVLELAAEFEAFLKAQKLSDVVAPLINQVSLGIGMTISHFSFPFAQALQTAHRAQRVAKRQVHGARSAVAWVDLTAETDAGDRYFTIADLLALRDDPGKHATLDPAGVVSMRNSARAVLAQLIRESIVEMNRSKLSVEAARRSIHRIESHADRNDLDGLAKFVKQRLEPHSKFLDINRESTIDILAALDDLGDWLQLARWWPAANPVSTVALAGGR